LQGKDVRRSFILPPQEQGWKCYFALHILPQSVAFFTAYQYLSDMGDVGDMSNESGLSDLDGKPYG